MIPFLLGCGPIATLLAAVVVRAIAAVQPDTSWAGSRRWTLILISFALLAISLVGMIFLMILAGPTGLAGMIMVIILGASMIEAEIRIAGVRNRARQVELLWVLAMAIKSGRPLEDEIEAYAQGTSGRRHAALMGMSRRLREGVPLTELVVPQGLLPRSAAIQINAGIASSSLHDSLEDTARRYTQQMTEDQTAGHPAAAMLYPTALLPIVLLMVSFLMYYIIPKFKKIFDDFGSQLPRVTIFLIHLSDLFLSYWYILILPLIYIPVAMFVYLGLAEYYGWRDLTQSTLGRWFVRFHSPDILRALAQTVSQQTPIDKALMSISKYSGPLNLRERVAWAAEQVRSGTPSWQSLHKAGLISTHETILLETAERTGNLVWVLETLASNMERRWSFRFRVFLEFLQPALLIVISLIVGFVVLAFFMPVVKLISELS